MKRNLIKGIALVGLMLISNHSLFAQSEKATSLFSHKGIKAALGLGTIEMPSENSLNEGDAGTLSLGYGFSDRSTLWLSLAGAEYPARAVNQNLVEFGGLELSYQYKFRPQSGLQPYGKIGVGIYGVHERDTNLTIWGGGLNFALGADYFFSRHFGIGAEVNFKDIEYAKESREVNGDVITSDLIPHLNRDSGGFLITLTIQ